MNVKGNHPLAEILARKLVGIETVPAKEQRRMVNRAIKEATKYHDTEISKYKQSTRTLNDCTRTLNNWDL